MKRRIYKWLLAAALLLLVVLLLSIFEIRCFGCFQGSSQNHFGYFRGDDIHVCVNNFPDKNFRQFIRDTYCTGEHNVLSVQQLDAVTEMDCSGLGCKNLRGIELFARLTKLDCSDNHIKQLPSESMYLLTDLDCSNNRISQLRLVYNMQLQTLNCENNNISSLSFSNQNITSIDCSGNNLKYEYCFDSLRNSLTYLDCGNNQFRDLDLHNMTQLRTLVLSPQNVTITTNPNLNTTLISESSRNHFLSCEHKDGFTFYTLRVTTQTIYAEMEVCAAYECAHRYKSNGPLSFDPCIHCGAPKTTHVAWVKIFLWACPLCCVMFLVAVIYLRRRKAKGKDWGEVTNVQIHDRDLHQPDQM